MSADANTPGPEFAPIVLLAALATSDSFKGSEPTDDPNVVRVFLKDGWTILVGVNAVCGPFGDVPLLFADTRPVVMV